MKLPRITDGNIDREFAASALGIFVAIAFVVVAVSWTMSGVSAACGARDLFRAAASPCRWNIRSLAYRDTLNFSGVADHDVARARQGAYDALQAACGIRFRPAAEGEWANLVAEVTSMPSDIPNALAVASVVCGGGPGHGEWQRYNQDSYWDAQRIYAASLHEIGHNLGLGHDEDPLSMMRAVLNEKITGPGPTDIANLQIRYGKPGGPMPEYPPDPPPFQPTPPAPPAPAPPPSPPAPQPKPSPTPMPNPPPQDPFTEKFDLALGTQHQASFRQKGDAMVASFYIPKGGYRTVIARTFGTADVKLTLASKTRVLAEDEHGAPDGRNAKIVWRLPQGTYTARVECTGTPGRCVMTAAITEPAR